MDLLHTAHVPAGDGPFSTLVLLHGYGANAHDLFGLAPAFGGGKVLVLCPQAPLGLVDQGRVVGFGWFPITMGGPPDIETVERALGLVEDFLAEAVERYPVDLTKLVLGGFSQGGVLAYQIALRDPDRFAALVALSSWLPDQLASQITPTDAHAALQTMVMHGADDEMISVDRGRESRDALIKLGVPTAYREYAGVGHGIGPDGLRDLVGWLDEKVLNPIQLA